MQWIVIGEEKGRVQLVSQSSVSGMIPKGSFLTVEVGEVRHVLRVDDSVQHNPFAPTPLIADLGLQRNVEDQASRNIISCYRVREIGSDQQLLGFIPPQSMARLSTQEEIDVALDSHEDGPSVFLGTIQFTENRILKTAEDMFATVSLPEDMFYHQMMICGRTGSGKTVALKYLAQHFVEEMDGAVLAVNVKDVDFLQMNRPSVPGESSQKEWDMLGVGSRGVENTVIYHPSNVDVSHVQSVDREYFNPITLDVASIEPEALSGLLRNVSDTAAQNLPNVFRYWRDKHADPPLRFADFIRYFNNARNDGRRFQTLNTRGDESEVTLHPGTFENVVRNLDNASEFFDADNAATLSEKDILDPGKLSIIDVSQKKGTEFGSVLLRDLLSRIVDAKSTKQSDVPVLVIIDEVHSFYNSSASQETLGDLATICRTGRSQKIGVIFASQNPSDLPRGLANVINTRISFKSDQSALKLVGASVGVDEIENLRPGFAVSSIYGLPQVRIVKFPLAFAGVNVGDTNE